MFRKFNETYEQIELQKRNRVRWLELTGQSRQLTIRMENRLKEVCKDLNHPVCTNLNKLIARGKDVSAANKAQYIVERGDLSKYDPTKETGVLFTDPTSNEYCEQSLRIAHLPKILRDVMKYRQYADTHCNLFNTYTSEEYYSNTRESLGIPHNQKERVNYWLQRWSKKIQAASRANPLFDIQRVIRKTLGYQLSINQTQNYSSVCEDLVALYVNNITAFNNDFAQRTIALANVPKIYILLACEPHRIQAADILFQLSELVSVFNTLQIVNRFSSDTAYEMATLLAYSPVGYQPIFYPFDKTLDLASETDIKAIQFIMTPQFNLDNTMNLIALFGSTHLLNQTTQVLNLYRKNLPLLSQCYANFVLYSELFPPVDEQEKSLRIQLDNPRESLLAQFYIKNDILPKSWDECLHKIDNTESNQFLDYSDLSEFDADSLDPMLMLPAAGLSLLVALILLMIMINRRTSIIKPIKNCLRLMLFSDNKSNTHHHESKANGHGIRVERIANPSTYSFSA